MIRRMYSVFDDAAKAFATPFFMPTDAMATRAFVDAMQKDENLSKYPKDYSLYRIGEFDDARGTLSHEERPIPVMSGFEAKNYQEDNK